MLNSVFVYGTLMSGQSNNRRLFRETLVTPGTTIPRYLLRHMGFPAAVPERLNDTSYPSLQVRGEVFTLNHRDSLVSLDALEGEGSFYHRREIDVTGDDEVVHRCYIYEMDETGFRDPCDIENGFYVWKRRY